MLSMSDAFVGLSQRGIQCELGQYQVAHSKRFDFSRQTMEFPSQALKLLESPLAMSPLTAAGTQEQDPESVSAPDPNQLR
mmetsp:Transcript_23535/g.38671  ORF Transcript_23535/g.38671 Transcript_23535/m.38671 type:complete len:80 (+) Transcript_23535:677-916(+)